MFKIPSPKRDVSLLGGFKQIKQSKSRVPKVMVLYLGGSRRKVSNACFCTVGVFQGLSLACLVGLLLFMEWDFFSRASHLLVVSSCHLFGGRWICFRACHWPAWSACCFSWSGISSVELPICLLSLAAIYLGEGGFVSGPVTGLLGRPAAFHGVGCLQ